MFTFRGHIISKSIALVVMFMMIGMTTVFPVCAEEQSSVPIQTDRDVSDSTIFMNNTFTVNYSITPQPIPYENNNPAREKEIVLIIDVSGSMEWDIEGNITYWNHLKRSTIAKNAANHFLNQISGKEGVKVSLVSYSNKADVNKGLTTRLNEVSNAINALRTNGGTNIGDGMRRGYYELEKGSSEAEKYFILLTDGEPTYHSLDRFRRYYMSDGAAFTHDGGGSTATSKDKEYCCKVIDELINTKDYNSYMIAFSKGCDKNILEDLANRAGAQYKEADSSDALEGVYQEISNDIVSDISVSNVKFEEAFPEGLRVVSVPDGFTVSEQTVTGSLGNIYYNYNEETNQYEAEPIDFSFTLKGITAGDYILGENRTSSVTYKDMNGEAATKYFPETAVSVKTFGEPEFERENVVKNGDVVRVVLRVTLPEYTDYAQFRTEEGTVVPVKPENGTGPGNITDIQSDGLYSIDNLSIYKTHQVKLWAISLSEEENESELQTIYHAIDIN